MNHTPIVSTACIEPLESMNVEISPSLKSSKRQTSNKCTDNEQSDLSKRQKLAEDTRSIVSPSVSCQDADKSRLITTGNNNQPKSSIGTHYQDTPFSEKNTGYFNFSDAKDEPTQSTLTSTCDANSDSTKSSYVKKILNQAAVTASSSDFNDDDGDERQKKLAAAKKLIFPEALAESFSEISSTLRNERRQEFCPIYKDETSEQIALRQQKQKPIGSLLAKRIRWDDLKRKREEEQRKAQTQFHYGPYGPIYSNQQSQPTLPNPYEEYHRKMQLQYEQMAEMNRVQQEHSGFWPEYYQPSSSQNKYNNQTPQNFMQHQMQSYSYPYAVTQPNTMFEMNRNMPSSTYISANPHLYYTNMNQPPPPPPDEPYPY